MDVLSEIIAGLRIGQARGCRVLRSGAWDIRYKPMTASGFHLLVRGRAWLITPDEEPRLLMPGDVVLAPSGAEHGLSHTPDATWTSPEADVPEQPGNPAEADADVELICGAYWLEQVPPPPLLDLLPRILLVTPDYTRDSALRSWFDLFETHLSDLDPGGAITRSALLDLLLTRVVRQWIREQGGDLELDDPAVVRALQQIHADPGSPWSVPRLSSLSNLSQNQFTQRFRAATGRSPGAYLRDQRLSYAARLLRDTSDPLSAIASRVGYAHEFALSSAFRRKYGLPPGRFRTAARAAKV